jgi:hypothetical protein
MARVVAPCCYFVRANNCHFALLRVSKRNFEERRREIEQYRFCGDQNERSSSDVEQDALAAIFAEETFLKNRKRGHARGRAQIRQ